MDEKKPESLPQAIKQSVKHKRPKDGLTAAQRKTKKMWRWMQTDPEYKKIFDQLGEVDQRKIRCYDSIKQERKILLKALGTLIDRVRTAHMNKFDDFHVARILEAVGRILPAIDILKGDRPVLNPDRLIDIRFDEPYDYLKTKKKVKKLTKEEIVKMFVTFFIEYQIGHEYPGADNGVYADTAAGMVTRALESVDIDPTDNDAVGRFLTEGPNPFAL